MKNIIYIAFIALGFCACDNTEEILNQTPETLHSPAVYHMSLQASFDAQTRSVTFDGALEDDDDDGVITSITTEFLEGDEIYVYNETKQAFARDASTNYELSYLQPTNIFGNVCTLEGDLTFYKRIDANEWEVVTVDADDTYSLYYRPFFTQGNDFGDDVPQFYYNNQDGSAGAASWLDFAEATGITMTLSENTLTAPNDICFHNLQSMFRLQLSFLVNGEPLQKDIKRLTISTTNGTLLWAYNPSFPEEQKYETYDLDLYNLDISYQDNITAGFIYLSLAFHYTEDYPAKDDQLILTAVDDEDNVWQCVKAVPKGGFQNSKYYYGSCEMEWQYQCVKPEVTRSDGGNENDFEPDLDGWYNIYSHNDNPIDITISGNSVGYRFYLNNVPAVVTLTGTDNPVSAYWSGQNAFIESDDDLTIILDCNYEIDNSLAFEKGIDCGGELKLKTTGSTQTLTVITNDGGDFAYGIYGGSNFDAMYYDFDDIGNLADDGFTVTCPGPVDNGNYTYTWVYTVTPNN